MLLALSVCLLAAAAYLVGEVATQPGRERQRAVRRAATYGRVRVASSGLDRLRFGQRVVVPAIASFARLGLRMNPRVTLESIAARLLAAGMSRTVTPTAFLAAKGAGAVAGGLVGLALGGFTGGASIGFMLALCFAGAGFIAPGFIVSMRARKRREEIRA